MRQGYTILSLDIATNLGYAVAEDGVILESGTKNLYPPGASGYSKLWMQGHRLKNFREFLWEIASKGCDEIIIESIDMNPRWVHSATPLIELKAVFKDFVVEAGNIRVTQVKPKFLKNALTGLPNADKVQMCAACHAMGWQGGVIGTQRDNDEADACALIIVVLKARGVTVTFKN